MTNPGRNPRLDGYFKKAKQWPDELRELRRIVTECPLAETTKWRGPCYTWGEANVAMVGAFKAGAVLSFFKGALLKDPQGILEKPGENTQAGRVVRFTSVEQIRALEPVLKAYLHEAIEVEQAGLKVEFKPVEDFAAPDELEAKFRQNPKFKAAFEALTPGRRRGYLLHFNSAKQSCTRTARIEKSTPAIFAGKGLYD